MHPIVGWGSRTLVRKMSTTKHGQWRCLGGRRAFKPTQGVRFPIRSSSKSTKATPISLKDILALTKLNYNTCIFGDGMPITLKFADAVGEILTAGPIKDVPPLPFGALHLMTRGYYMSNEHA